MGGAYDLFLLYHLKDPVGRMTIVYPEGEKETYYSGHLMKVNLTIE